MVSQAARLDERRRRFGTLPAGLGFMVPISREDEAFWTCALEASWSRLLLDDDFSAWFEPLIPQFSRLHGNAFYFENRPKQLMMKRRQGDGVAVFLVVDEIPVDASVREFFDDLLVRWLGKIAETLGVASPPKIPSPQSDRH